MDNFFSICTVPRHSIMADLLIMKNMKFCTLTYESFQELVTFVFGFGEDFERITQFLLLKKAKAGLLLFTK